MFFLKNPHVPSVPPYILQNSTYSKLIKLDLSVDEIGMNNVFAFTGPTKQTTDSFATFWKMVWFHNSDTIVMLTNLIEDEVTVLNVLLRVL